jgi:hypothetical protein
MEKKWTNILATKLFIQKCNNPWKKNPGPFL